MKRWHHLPSAYFLGRDLLQMVPALQPERGRQVSYPDQCLFHALLLSGFTGIKLIYSYVWVNAQTCYRTFPEEIMVDKCVSVLHCYQRMESGFSIITSSATLGTRYAQHVWNNSHTKGSFLPSPTHCCSLPLAWGYLAFCNTMRVTQNSPS